MLFSATFKKRIERLAMDVLTDPLKIIHGESGEANEDITQTVVVLEEGPQKWEWLTGHLVDFMSQGSVLIFVTKKANADELAANLTTKEFDLLLIHGDMDQNSRNRVITSFKKKEKPILVATDVAARGLDIPHVRTVVNYDVARDIDTHTHRIGRTGRAGEKGSAYTLVTEKDKEFAGHLVRNLEAANQAVSPDLMNLAMKSSWFKNSRFKSNTTGGGSRRRNAGGSGLGFKSRPSLSNSIPSSSPSGARLEASSASTPQESPATRIAQMRASYAAQYSRTFKAASDTSWTSGTQSTTTTTATASASNSASSGGESGQQKKRSRWN